MGHLHVWLGGFGGGRGHSGGAASAGVEGGLPDDLAGGSAGRGDQGALLGGVLSAGIAPAEVAGDGDRAYDAARVGGGGWAFARLGMHAQGWGEGAARDSIR